MQFANPYAVTCPSCAKVGGYHPRALVSLRSRCQHCEAPLDSVGREMRAQLTEWNAYVARIEMAIELERAFGVTVEDADLDAMETPFDFVRLLRAQSITRPIESEVVAVLSRVRRASAGTNDLRRNFTDLFPVEEHP